MIKAAVTGVGAMGCSHARICHELPDGELVAVADTREERAAVGA